ncbi:MAG: YebC/PmpR family DNA-binding transcriptional regulator, partial [Gammaproteobacteria bacterium]|nr:YebC/PmpR family DNA-binding transcriptional regulator [Gammaproteobacteria bacterium]
AAKQGGGDANANPRLRLAIDKALGANMTRDTVDRAVKRGSGAMDGDNYEEVRYEGYGPGGVAVMVDCLTDNRNRTVSEVRHAFSKAGGNLGTDGSVAYIFSARGVISFSEGDEDAIMEAALEAGADDVIGYEDGSAEVLTSPEAFDAVKQAMADAGLEFAEAEVTQYPATQTEVDADTAPKLLRMIDMLEDLDDVQNVYHNADVSDDVMASL